MLTTHRLKGRPRVLADGLELAHERLPLLLPLCLPVRPLLDALSHVFWHLHVARPRLLPHADLEFGEATVRLDAISRIRVVNHTNCRDQRRAARLPMALMSPSFPPLFAAPILRPANSAYSRSVSAPTKKRPSSLAATPVVPDPQNGSKTRAHSAVEAKMARRRRRRGFWVGWRPWDFSLLGTAGMRQTEETCEVGSGLFMRS
jgi:hypothetical protein